MDANQNDAFERRLNILRELARTGEERRLDTLSMKTSREISTALSMLREWAARDPNAVRRERVEAAWRKWQRSMFGTDWPDKNVAKLQYNLPFPSGNIVFLPLKQGKSVITKESAAKLVDFAKAVQKFAKAGDREEQNAVDRENSRRAWVLLKVLKDCCEHLEQADLYYTLSDMPAKTPKDRARCAQIAKNENFDLMLAMREFERQLKEFDATPARKTVKLPDDAVLPAGIARRAVVKKPVAKKAAAKKSVAKKTVAKRAALKKAA